MAGTYEGHRASLHDGPGGSASPGGEGLGGEEPGDLSGGDLGETDLGEVTAAGRAGRRAPLSTWLRLLLLVLGPLLALAGAAGLLMTLVGPLDIAATCGEAAGVSDREAGGARIERSLIPAQQTCVMPDGRRIDLLPASATTMPLLLLGAGAALTLGAMLTGARDRRAEDGRDGDLDDIEGLDDAPEHPDALEDDAFDESELEDAPAAGATRPRHPALDD